MAWRCPGCGKIFSDQEAQRFGFFCPTCSINLEPYRAGLKTKGMEVKGMERVYVLQAQVGSGGQASVWEAEAGGKNFVLKFMAKESALDILQIYKKIKGISHTVPLLDWGDFPPDDIFLVFPYFSLGHLRRNLFLKEGSLDWELLQDFLIQMSEALEDIHIKGVVHRDVKPENIMVEKEGTKYNFSLGDFGIATLHSVTTVNLTPAYAPPELVIYLGKTENVKSQVTHKIDWWSLGVVLLWLITGKNPFQANSPAVVVSKIRNFDRDNYMNSLPIPPRWKLLLRGLLTKNPVGRWDASQVKAWLSGAGNIPVSAQSVSFTAIRFMGYDFYSYEDFASFAWSQPWDSVIQDLFGEGNIFSILSNAPSDLRADISGIIQSKFSEEKELALILWRMNPSLPFGFRGTDFPDLASLLNFLLENKNPSFLDTLKSEKMFSSYFSLVGGGNIYGIKINQEKLQEIEKWENGDFSPLSLALVLDDERRRDYVKKTRAQLRNIESKFLLSPTAESWIYVKETAAKSLVSKVDISFLEELVKSKQELKNIQGEMVEKKKVLSTSDYYIANVRKFLNESVPVDQKGENCLVAAGNFLKRFSQVSVWEWDDWVQMNQEYNKLSQMQAKANFLSKQSFINQIKNDISECQKIISQKLPLDSSSASYIDSLKSECQKIKNLLSLVFYRLKDYKQLVEFEQLLKKAKKSQLKGRREIRSELEKKKRDVSRWLSQKYWPSSKRDVKKKLLEIQTKSIERLSDEELREYYNFIKEQEGRIENLPSKGKILFFRLLMGLSVPVLGFIALSIISLLSGYQYSSEYKWLYIPFSFASLSYPFLSFSEKAESLWKFISALLWACVLSSLLGLLFGGPFIWFKHKIWAWKIYEIIVWIGMLMWVVGLLMIFSDENKEIGFLAFLVLGFGYLNDKILRKLEIKEFYPVDRIFDIKNTAYIFHGVIIAPAIFYFFVILFLYRFRIASLGMLLAWVGFCFFRNSWVFPALVVAGAFLAFFSKPETYIEIGRG